MGLRETLEWYANASLCDLALDAGDRAQAALTETPAPVQHAGGYSEPGASYNPSGDLIADQPPVQHLTVLSDDESKLLIRVLKAKIKEDNSKHFNGKLWGHEIVDLAALERLLARLENPSPVSREVRRIDPNDPNLEGRN